ncbi:hypothetical protein N7501_004292 [Penicillium viridicatum]|nr:hypothetical protein N7501_004292 [Penicillium viridicatum]
MPSNEATDQPIAINKAAPIKKIKPRRKQVRPQKENFARKFQRTGLLTINVRPPLFSSSSNTNNRLTEGQDDTKKDRDQVPDFKQPFAIRLKNNTTVAESPSETLSLTLRPKGDIEADQVIQE